MKEYTKSCNGEDAKNIMKIRTHMQEVKMHYKKDVGGKKYPLFTYMMSLQNMQWNMEENIMRSNFKELKKSRKVAGDTENVNKRLEKERYAVRENEKKKIE